MRVFGIGLNKTGTTSLAQACDVLGLRSFHHEGLRFTPQEVEARLARAVEEGRHPFRYAARLRLCKALFDLRSVERNFEYYDRSFPKSKFILHTRDRDSWLASREKHVQFNRRSGRGIWAEVDLPAWSDLWDSHHERVTSYFRSRPDDLLIIDVVAGDGWQELCTFLGRPVPDRPFPFANRAKL